MEDQSHKEHLEICLPIRRLLSGLIGMWSSMKTTLVVTGNVFLRECKFVALCNDQSKVQFQLIFCSCLIRLDSTKEGKSYWPSGH